MPRLLARRGGQTLAALVAYIALTVAMTWPVSAGLARDIPGDLGDSLLVMGIMGWVSEGILAIADGSMPFADLWNINVFDPTPLGLTFSEHFIPQALQGLPFYVATGNIVLAYNVVLLATFVLSGLGTFLFVRELTGSARAAFVAGLFFAFFPYRWNNLPHLHTLSSQWMPFALYGFRRYFDTRSRLALAGGALAFLVQGLSSGYFLFFFAPVLASYVVWEIAVRGLARDWRTWRDVGVSGALTVGGALPFLLPYAQAQAQFGHARALDDLAPYSADLLTYLSAPPQMRLWGPVLTRFAQAEGGIFLGAVPAVAAAIAIALWLYRVRRDRAARPATSSRDRLARWLFVGAAVFAAAALAVALDGGRVWQLAGVTLRMTSPWRPLEYGLVLVVAAVGISPPLRAAIRAQRADLTPWLAIAIVFAVVMSLGPHPRIGGDRVASLGVYEFFFDHVPGYEGLRVPARFGMVVGCLVAVLAGVSLARLARTKHGSAALAAIGLLFLVEAHAAPVDVNLSWRSSERFEAPWPAVRPLNEGPLAYRHALLMPASTVLLELPFGDEGWDLRYVYYAGLHGKRIVNGYSGYFPLGYAARTAALTTIWNDRDAAWRSLTTSTATHVLVHERAYPRQEGPALSGWLESQGAKREATFADGDVLLALPSR